MGVVHARLPILASTLPEPSLQLPTVAALEALWAEVASRPLWAPPNFWRYLRLRRRSRLRLLDPARLSMCAPVGKINDCHSCTDICCVGPQSAVLLRLRDIATLHDVGRTALMTHRKPAFSAAALASRPALRRQVGSLAWDVFPVLRQDSMGACAALSVSGACTLYPHWPLACARFPYALHLDDEEVFYSQRCQSYWVHPAGQARVEAMAAAAVAGYNERIKDLILLEYAPKRLQELGLLTYLNRKTSG